MTDDVKIKSVDTSNPDEKGKETVPKTRLDEVIGERNVLREKEETWTTREKELLADIEDFGDIKQLKELINENPKLANIVMESLQKEYGRDKEIVIPQALQRKPKSKEAESIEDIKQELADIKIEKHFDTLGVKDEQIKDLNVYCKAHNVDMTDVDLLGAVYKNIFPEIKEDKETSKDEPDSSTSGLVYGDREIKSVHDAVQFGVDMAKARKKK